MTGDELHRANALRSIKGSVWLALKHGATVDEVLEAVIEKANEMTKEERCA